MDLVEQIQRWATENPSRLAHISDQGSLSYGDLHRSSDAFAAFLNEEMAADYSPLAIVGHKQSEMLIGFLGSLKAGHPYIPIDSSLPEARLRTIVKTAEARLFSVQEIREVVSNADRRPREYRWPDRSAPWYIIFTSGSTGDPKGVVVTRASLEDFLEWTMAEQRFAPAGEVYLNQAPFSFDLSVMDLYSSLLTGGTLFSVTHDQVATPKILFKALRRSELTAWVSTPSFARMCLMQPTFSRAMLPQVRKFWFCGETLAPEVASELLRRFPGAEVWNTYGPTEATVATSSINITRSVVQEFNPLPVGRIKPGTRVVICDERGRSLAAGERGEIVIAGPNVSLGYLNRPDLTASNFSTLHGERSYHTGDAGHFDGDLLFFDGRMDFQIKLHGYRVELGDIEANLHRLADIQDAVVLPHIREGRAEYLVAFAILKSSPDGSDFEISQRLRLELASHLPDYMVPRKFIFLPAFPTTSNGKVDRRVLAERLS